MSIISLYAGNKNQFRKYPIKQGASFQADNGVVVPDDLIVNCSITTLYGRHRLYVRQIYRSGTSVRVAIAAVDDPEEQVLGMFYGDVIQDFTTLTFVPFVRNISGSLTIGSAKSVAAITDTMHFTKTTSELEESTIFCYRPPAVSSILDKKGTQLRGDVKFGILTNIKKSNLVARTTQFTVTNPASVFNKADKSTFLGNCPNPIIKTINNVAPYPMGEKSPENDGNIYIVGVKPIMFYGVPGASPAGIPGTLKVVTPTVSLDSLCTQKHKLLPPAEICGFADPSKPNTYYSKPALLATTTGTCDDRPARANGSYYNTLRPEYYFWPQFLKKPDYYDKYWNNNLH